MVMNTILSSVCIVALASCTLSPGPTDVSDGPLVACSLDGARNVTGGADADALCKRFAERFERGLAESSDAIDGRDFSVHIEIGKRGAVQAQISGAAKDGESKAYPIVAIDVIDRAVSPDDIDQLADSVARYLAAQ